MQTSHPASVATVVIVLTVVGIAAVAGPAAALDGTDEGGISPDPRTPNATDSQHNVRVTVEEGDAVVGSGVRNITIDYGADERFNGSVVGVSAGDVRAFVNGSEIEVANVSVTEAGDRLAITLEETAPVAPGGSVIARIEGITNPGPSGRTALNAEVLLGNGTNATDETTTSYTIVPAGIRIADQTVPSNDTQNLTIDGTVPNRGYVAVYTIGNNSTVGDLLGVTPSIPPNFNNRELTNLFPLDLGGNLTQTRAVCTIAYYETTGGSQSIRARQSFNRTEDAAFRNDGVVVNDTAVVSVEGSGAANVMAPATCRPRPENVLTPDEGNGTNASMANGTNASMANETMDNGTTNNTTANTTTTRTTGTPVLVTTTTATPEPTTGTPEPTTTETPTDETTIDETTAGTDTTTETPTPTATATPEPTATATPEPTAEATETPAPTPEPTTTSGNGPGFGIVLALAGVVVTVAALLVARRR